MRVRARALAWCMSAYLPVSTLQKAYRHIQLCFICVYVDIPIRLYKQAYIYLDNTRFKFASQHQPYLRMPQAQRLNVVILTMLYIYYCIVNVVQVHRYVLNESECDRVVVLRFSWRCIYEH